jgi:vacuolar-type H+-ATPase subunit H
MTKQDAGIELKQDEFSRIFDEYRAKIEEITRRTEKSLHSADVTPGNNSTDENEHIEVISTPSRPEAVVVDNDPKQADSTPPAPPQPAHKAEAVNTHTEIGRLESAEILYEARREAKRIIEEAEESAKKEAKKRTQSQVDKIIEKAKKEAAEIVARANREAEKVSDEVITESKREADYIILENTQK